MRTSLRPWRSGRKSEQELKVSFKVVFVFRSKAPLQVAFFVIILKKDLEKSLQPKCLTQTYKKQEVILQELLT